MKKVIIFSILIMAAGQGYAENSKSDSVKYRFNPVVVTATKVQGAQRDIAASVTVLDQKAIDEAMSNSALELVKDQTPGVFITERAVMGYGVAQGAAGGISIRGVGGSPTTGVLILKKFIRTAFRLACRAPPEILTAKDTEFSTGVE